VVAIRNWILLLLHPVLNCNHIAPEFPAAHRKDKEMVENASSQNSECPVARTLEAIGDRWSLMIIRDAFDDIRRFSEFQRSLGVAKNILASRLKTLVEIGIFEVRPASDGSAYMEYVLTDKGREIFPVVVSMRQWGERFLFKPEETRSVLLDNQLGEPLMPIEVRSTSGRKLTPSDCHRVRRVDGES
jgi:DNA-binding HxlR family transcriptional regulator